MERLSSPPSLRISRTERLRQNGSVALSNLAARADAPPLIEVGHQLSAGATGSAVPPFLSQQLARFRVQNAPPDWTSDTVTELESRFRKCQYPFPDDLISNAGRLARGVRDCIDTLIKDPHWRSNTMAIQPPAKGWQDPMTWPNLQIILAAGCLECRNQFQFWPNPVQLMATAMTILNPARSKGVFLQILTGEGKSLTIALIALVQAWGKTPGIVITPYTDLAKRDSAEFKPFFAAFGLQTQCISDSHFLRVQYSGHIIYGVISDFEFVELGDVVYATGALQNAPYNWAIADEADVSLADMMACGARISHPTTKTDLGELDQLFEAIHRHHLPSDFLGFIRGLAPLFPDVDPHVFSQAWRTLHNMQEGEDYRLVKLADGSTQIMLVGELTGESLEGMRLTDVAHYFLERKHGLTNSAPAITIAQISQASFFEKIEKLICLSGTLGLPIERDTHKAIFGIISGDVPSYQPCRRDIYPPIWCPTDTDYLAEILKDTQAIIRNDRPVLILVRSITDSETVARYLRDNGINPTVINASSRTEIEVMLKNAGGAGTVTVGTARAGRGANIRLSRLALERGGLHVIFGYVAKRRYYEQGIGRGARQFQPGSARHIVNAEDPTNDLAEIASRHASTGTRFQVMWDKIDTETEQECRELRVIAQSDKQKWEWTQRHYSAIRQLSEFPINPVVWQNVQQWIKAHFLAKDSIPDMVTLKSHLNEKWGKILAASGHRQTALSEAHFKNLDVLLGLLVR